MVSKKVKVINENGIHARPAGNLVKKAEKFKCDINIETGNKSVSGKSILFLMAAGIKSGAEILVICDGEDEKEALEEITEYIASGLGE